MNFNLFFLNYKSKIYKNLLIRVPLKEVPKYRRNLLILFFISMFFLLCYFCKNGKDIFKLLPFSTLIGFIVMIVLSKFLEFKEENKKALEKMMENAYQNDIQILKTLLKEKGLFNKKSIDYLIDFASEYKNKYSLKEILKIPNIILILFSSIFYPRLQKEVGDLKIEIFLFLLIIYVIISALIYVFYNLYTLFIIPNYEISEKLIKDLKYIQTFEKNLKNTKN